MDRKQFKEAVIPVLYSLGEGVSAVKFITPRGTDYTEYVADKLYNAVEERLKIISSNPMLCDSLQQDSEMLFHECPNCNVRCNCSDQPCSCCNVA